MDKNDSYGQKLLRTSVTLDKRTVRLAMELKKRHGAASMSDYIEGLIALDALRTNKEPLDIRAVRPWIIGAFELDVEGGKVQPKS